MGLEALREWNPHWYGAPVTPRVLKHPEPRAVVRHWVDDLLHPPQGMWALKPGPRQVGKTSSLGHVARTLLEVHKVEPKRIVLAAMDDEGIVEATGGRLEALIQASRALHAPTKERPNFILLDEIQEYPDWASQLKSAWDRHHRETRLLATGSSALRLLRPIDADFHGRIRTVTVHPMKFREVLLAHPLLPDHVDPDGIEDLKEAIVTARDALVEGHPRLGTALERLHGTVVARGAWDLLQQVWLQYCAWGGYPAVRPGSHLDGPMRLDQMEGAFNTVLARDVAEGGIRKPRDFRRLLRQIARNPGGKFEPYGIGKDLGVDGKILKEWKQILEDVMLVQQLEPLKPNLAPHKGTDKAYVTDPAWISYFRGHTGDALDPDDPLIGLIVETVVVDHARRLRFNTRGTTALPIGYVHEPEVDLALDLGSNWLLIEAKYSSRPRVRLARIGPKEAIRLVVTRDRFETGPPGNPHHIPAPEFALLA